MIGQTVSHYQVLSRLGSGGMGEVYKAQDLRLERPVALKFLAPHVLGSREGRQRFLREARAAASLSHPAICTVYEIDEIDGQVFIAMEFVAGQNLAARIRAGPVPVPEAVAIITQVAAGLQEAHRKGFIHRDIKPANLMVTPAGRVVILDFGLVRSLEASRLSTVDLMPGTTAYLSPEQVRCEAVDQRADIWALGVVLYEMLAGERPFQGEIDQATLYQIVHEEPRPLSELVPDLPSNLARVAVRALAKDPGARYQRIAQLLEDLQAPAATGDPAVVTDSQTAALRIPSIAVLPFTNLTGDPEREYLCDGMTEELINALVTIRSLKVIARTSSFAFKGRSDDIRQIGKILNVASVLEGSVQLEGDRIRITAQLIDTRDGCHLWSQRFDRELTDIFVLQDEIALATVSYLKPKLLGRERDALLKRHTEDLQAYELWTKGRYFWKRQSREDLRTAEKYYQAAIARDPGFAPPYVGLAGVHCSSATFGYTPHLESFPKGIRAVQKAVELDDTLAKAHGGLGLIFLSFYYDWESGQREIERAQELDPDDYNVHLGWAVIHAIRGELDEALAWFRSLGQVEPFAVIQMFYMADALLRTGYLEEARQQINSALEIAPHFDQLRLLQGRVKVLAGDHEGGISSMRRAVELSGRSPVMLAGRGWALAMAGQTSAAQEVLAELNARARTEYVRPLELARFHTALGQKDEAFACLDQAYEGRDELLPHIRTDPMLRGLHQDPRWAELVARMRFPPLKYQARGAS